MSETKYKSRNNTNTWLSILAVVVSFGAFGVSIYEAGIMRDQQEIMYQEQQLMLEQQKASVWPYLESDISYMYKPEKSALIYKLKNKGVGPAKINHYDLSTKGTALTDYNQIFEVINAMLPANFDGNINLIFRPSKGILSPEEEITWLSIELPRFEGDTDMIRNLGLAFEFCYCSIYNDCWTLSSANEEPEEGCNRLKDNIFN